MEIKKGLKAKRKVKYPFAEMGINDCIEMKSSDVDSDRTKIYTAAVNYSKYNKLGWRFTSRTDKEKGIVRLWRVK